jgi:hypothetical protein
MQKRVGIPSDAQDNPDGQSRQIRFHRDRDVSLASLVGRSGRICRHYYSDCQVPDKRYCGKQVGIFKPKPTSPLLADKTGKFDKRYCGKSYAVLANLPVCTS